VCGEQQNRQSRKNVQEGIGKKFEHGVLEAAGSEAMNPRQTAQNGLSRSRKDGDGVQDEVRRGNRDRSPEGQRVGLARDQLLIRRKQLSNGRDLHRQPIPNNQLSATKLPTKTRAVTTQAKNTRIAI
jgi:hypothetical protein